MAISLLISIIDGFSFPGSRGGRWVERCKCGWNVNSFDCEKIIKALRVLLRKAKANLSWAESSLKCLLFVIKARNFMVDIKVFLRHKVLEESSMWKSCCSRACEEDDKYAHQVSLTNAFNRDLLISLVVTLWLQCFSTKKFFLSDIQSRIVKTISTNSCIINDFILVVAVSRITQLHLQHGTHVAVEDKYSASTNLHQFISMPFLIRRFFLHLSTSRQKKARKTKQFFLCSPSPMAFVAVKIIFKWNLPSVSYFVFFCVATAFKSVFIFSLLFSRPREMRPKASRLNISSQLFLGATRC